VLASIRELRYRPSRTAKTLAKRQSQTLSVAVPTFTTPFHIELLKGVRSQLNNVSLDLLLCDLDWSSPKESLLNFLARGAVDGLLLAGVSIDEDMASELKALGAPVVLIGARWPDIDAFYWEEKTGACMAVKHLIDRGHARIGMLTSPFQGPVRSDRIRGYREALEGAGLAYDADLVKSGQTEKHAGFSEEAGYEAMMSLLQHDHPPTAVFASSDVQAIGAWQALREKGLSVPDDISLVGYDDIKVSRFIGLTSVAQNMHSVGEAATELLLKRLKGVQGGGAVSRQIEPTLSVRASS